MQTLGSGWACSGKLSRATAFTLASGRRRHCTQQYRTRLHRLHVLSPRPRSSDWRSACAASGTQCSGDAPSVLVNSSALACCCTPGISAGGHGGGKEKLGLGELTINPHHPVGSSFRRSLVFQLKGKGCMQLQAGKERGAMGVSGKQRYSGRFGIRKVGIGWWWWWWWWWWWYRG